MYSFWFCFGFGGAGLFFMFCFPFLCIGFHGSSEAGQQVSGLGGQFLECKFRTLKKKKKVRTASDKFITRLNLIMSCSRSLFSESPPSLAVCPSVSSTRQAYRLEHPLGVLSRTVKSMFIQMEPKKKSPYISQKLLLL